MTNEDNSISVSKEMIAPLRAAGAGIMHLDSVRACGQNNAAQEVVS